MFEQLTKILPTQNVNPIENLSPTQRRDLGTQLGSISTYLTFAVLLLTPLFFLPVLADIFDLPRQTLFFTLTTLAATTYAFRLIMVNRPVVIRSVFDWPIILLALVGVVSALLALNKFAALGADPIVYSAAAIWFFLIAQIITRESLLTTAVKILLVSGAILGLWSNTQVIYSFLGVKLALPILAPYLNVNFSPTGSILSQTIFLATLLPIAAALFYQTLKKKETPVAATLSLVFILTGLLVNLLTLFTNRPIILPVEAGWKIATGTLGQSLITAFLGTGAAHFLDSFTLYKPVEFNNTLFWNLRFVTSSNFYFYLLATTGITGLVVFLWLAIRIIQTIQKRLETNLTTPLEKGFIASLITSLVLFALLPAPQVELFAFFTVLAFFVATLHLAGNTKYVFEDTDSLSSSSWQKPVLTLTLLIILLAGSVFLGRLVLADYRFTNSLKAAVANRGTETYNEQIAALQLNPWSESYRVAYSQTNLALANALAAQPNLSDQQKQTVLALVQQSIREGRNAVALAPRRSSDWENLSIVYRNLINFAQGADQFAIATQNQAINFDPTNPRLRLDLGGIYYSLKDYQSAAQVFAQAVALKPDYANAHYNLAQALKELKLKDQAVQQLQLAASLVCNPPAGGQSADCQKVNAEITALGGEQTASISATTSETPLATASAKSNLPKAATKPPAKVSSPSGELTPQ